MANEKRLADVDARIEEIKKAHCANCDNYGGVRCRACWVDDAIGLFDDAPTVDAVEVVHGQWKRRLVDWSAPYSWKVECSNCDFDICGLGDAVLFKYCPNCGAKMDGDGNV